MSEYSQIERAKARSSIKRLNDLAGEATRAAERGLILPPATEKGIIQITGASERSAQVDALSGLAEQLLKRHLEQLLPLARNEFNAFCEYVSSDEPPASPWHIWLTNKLQEIEFNSELDRFILNVPPGHAKPLHIDTPVLMGDGTWKRLADVRAGEKVISHTGAARRVTAVHEQGELPLLKITTARGRVINSAYDHPFMVDGGWTNAEDLRPGDKLTVVNGAPTEDFSGQTDDMFALMAYFSSRGSPAKFKTESSGGDEYRVWLKDIRLLMDIQARLDRLGIDHASRWSGPNTSYLLRLRGPKQHECATLMQLHHRAADRRIPDWVYLGSDDRVKTYLSTFLLLRGFSRTIYARPTVDVCVLNPDFARDLQRLYTRIGINSQIIHRPKRVIVRVEGHAVEALLQAGVTFSGYAHPTSIAKRVRYAKRNKIVDTALSDSVVSVEPADAGPCRCLTVETDQTFLADGVVVHNSTYASRLFVAWRMGRNPKMKTIGGGHSQRFVENEFSKKIRNLVGSPDFRRVFPDVVIDYSTRAADQWALAGTGGQYVAKGVGQAVHGFRANFACVDDPYAKIEEAESPVQREKVNTWFVGDIGSRMLPGGKQFLIMTRFHEEDLTGHLMEMNKRLPAYAQWMQVEAPALCIDPDTDILGRKLGEVLWDYYDLSYFVAKKTEWSFQRFSLVYQQNPSAMSDSNVSGQFVPYDVLPHHTPEAIKKAREAEQFDDAGRPQPDRREYFRRVILSVDTASKTNERADYTVIQTWGQSHDNRYYLMRQTRIKVEINAMIEAIEKQARKDKVDAILVEDKGQGTAYIQARGKTESQRRLAPAPIIPIDPKGQSKEFRFDEVSPMIASGEVYVPQKAPWLDAFIKEVGQFPEGAHDDQVDAMSQALRYFKSTRTRYGSKKITSFG